MRELIWVKGLEVFQILHPQTRKPTPGKPEAPTHNPECLNPCDDFGKAYLESSSMLLDEVSEGHGSYGRRKHTVRVRAQGCYLKG